MAEHEEHDAIIVIEAPKPFVTVDTVRSGKFDQEPDYLPRWKNVPAAQRPPGPEVEYYESPQLYAEWELREKWKGLNMDERIAALFARPEPERLESRIHAIVARNAGRPAVLTPEALSGMMQEAFMKVYHLWMSAVEDAAVGLARDPVKEFHPGYGVRTRVEVRPRNDKEKLQHAGVMKIYFEQMRTMMGQASIIVAHQTVEMNDQVLDSAAQRLSQWRQQQNRELNLTINLSNGPAPGTLQGTPQAVQEAPSRPQLVEATERQPEHRRVERH